MKLKNSEMVKIISDKSWIHIQYESLYAHGEMHMKMALYNLLNKKIDKLLKGCLVSYTFSEGDEDDNNII